MRGSKANHLAGQLLVGGTRIDDLEMNSEFVQFLLSLGNVDAVMRYLYSMRPPRCLLMHAPRSCKQYEAVKDKPPMRLTLLFPLGDCRY